MRTHNRSKCVRLCLSVAKDILKQVRSDMPDQREGFIKQVRAVVPEHSEGHIKAGAQRHARPARKTNKTDVCSYGYVKKKAKKIRADLGKSLSGV